MVSPSSVIQAVTLGFVLSPRSLCSAHKHSLTISGLCPCLHPNHYCLISGMCHPSDGSTRQAVSDHSPSNPSVLFSAVIKTTQQSTWLLPRLHIPSVTMSDGWKAFFVLLTHFPTDFHYGSCSALWGPTAPQQTEGHSHRAPSLLFTRLSRLLV